MSKFLTDLSQESPIHANRANLYEWFRAQKLGDRARFLQASKMGYPVYKRMGFKDDVRVGAFYCTLQS